MILVVLVGGGLGAVVIQLHDQNSQLQNDVNTLRTALLVTPTFTWTHGTVDISRSGTALWILFDNQDTGTLSSTVFSDNTFQLYLPTGKTYSVTVYYSALLVTQHCTARPGVFTPSGTDDAQNFLC